MSGDDHVGGLVGAQYNSSSITNAYATGAVSGGSIVGGLVGWQDGSIVDAYATGAVSGNSHVGGLIGVQYNGSITNAYATGAVSGVSNAGGLVGTQLGGGSITNSFWDVDTTGQTNAAGATSTGTQTNVVGLTNAQAFSASSYTGWSIGTTTGYSVPAGDWLMIDGETRPFLAFEHSTEIANAHQLQLMVFDLDADYNLTNDIDASHTNGATHPSQMWSTRGFVPVGIFPNDFTGDFNGHGHTISELFINRPGTDMVGLFGYTDGATIANVGMVGGSVTGNSNVGGLVGLQASSGSITNVYATVAVSGASVVGGLVGNQQGDISNAHATGAVTGDNYVGGLVGAQLGDISNAHATGAVSGDDAVGGLVGYQIAGNITNAYATGAVTGDELVGGLVGYQNSGDDITNAYATGAVSGDTYVGGLVGYQKGNISNAYATGSVSGDTDVGGLVGYQIAGNITNAYATGAVTGDELVGGLVGYQNSGDDITNAYATGAVSGDTYVGGLVGYQKGNITNAYATGAVSGITFIGGLVGQQTGSITNSFWDVDTTGRANAVGNLAGSISGTIGLHTTEFQDTAGFMSQASGWDFENVWAPPSNGYYPELYALSQVVWVQADDVSRIYGDENPALTTAGIYGGPDIYVFGPAGDVLSFSPTLSTAADTSSSVGSYAITGSPNSATSAKGQNYRVVYSGDLTVTPAALRITANDDTKAYNDLPYIGGNGVSYSGFVNGESAGVLNGMLNYGGTAQGAVNPKNYTITPKGLVSANYTITFVDGILMLFSAPGMQTDVPGPIDEGLGQNIVCPDGNLLSCELVEVKF